MRTENIIHKICRFVSALKTQMFYLFENVIPSYLFFAILKFKNGRDCFIMIKNISFTSVLIHQISLFSLCSCTLKMKWQRIYMKSTQRFPCWRCCSIKGTSCLFFCSFDLFRGCSTACLWFCSILENILIAVTITFVPALQANGQRFVFHFPCQQSWARRSRPS